MKLWIDLSLNSSNKAKKKFVYNFAVHPVIVLAFTNYAMIHKFCFHRLSSVLHSLYNNFSCKKNLLTSPNVHFLYSIRISKHVYEYWIKGMPFEVSQLVNCRWLETEIGNGLPDDVVVCDVSWSSTADMKLEYSK